MFSFLAFDYDLFIKRNIIILLQKYLKSAWQIKRLFETVSVPYTTEACCGVHSRYTVILFIVLLTCVFLYSCVQFFFNSIKVRLPSLNHLGRIAYRKGGVLLSTYLITKSWWCGGAIKRITCAIIFLGKKQGYKHE